MDWLRIGAFGLLIFYHIGLVFVPWAYHAKTANPIPWVSVPLQAVNAWRLPLLFLVSGYASRAIFAGDARAGAFAWRRSKRLIVPLVFGIVVITPVQPWIELATQHGYARSFLHFWTTDYFRFGSIANVFLPAWQQLWFVGYLWFYTILLALALAVVPGMASDRLARWGAAIFAGPLVLIVPAALLIANWAWIYPGVHETHAFIDDWPVHRIYFSMFLFGFLLRESALIWRSIRRWWGLAAVMAIAGYAFVAWVEIRHIGPTLPTRQEWFWFGIARAVQSWGAIVALLGIADRYWNRDHRWRRMLNEAIFPFYIIHQSIIVLVAGELRGFALHPLAEFAIILIATIAGCWAFYRIGREIDWLRPLIGLRARLAPTNASARATA